MQLEKVPPESAISAYRSAAERLPKFIDQGFVISLDGEQKIHQGDSLLFSGLALYSLNCTGGQVIADGFRKMLTDLDGGAYRHPDLPGREVSLDGLLGMYRGITKRVMACGEKDVWAPLMKNHRARMAASLPAEFNLVSDSLAWKLGLAAEPDPKRKKALALEVATWASIVKASRSSAYRIHLGLLSLQILDDLECGVSAEDRGEFAQATSGVGMPTVDHYVGRNGLEEALAEFVYNKWQYAWQRSQVWETPDGYGMEHPAVDYLVGFSDLYGSPK